MPYCLLPLSFGDAADVLEELSSRPDLLARVKREPVSLLRWSLDRDSRSYLFSIGGLLEFEGSGYLFRFRGEYFELKLEVFGNRVAFYKPPKLTASTLAEVQATFSEAIAVYGRSGQGVNEPMIEPISPVFVDSFELLWKK